VGIEIERKFLVTREGFGQILPTHHVGLRQGYLSTETGRTVRVRLQNEQGYLTIKGKASGLARPEFEYPIPLADAESLLEMCPRPLIEKWRHYVEYAGKIWEVDEFFGDNEGLIVAELELESENESFEPPPWLGEEVTFDARYHNSRLAERPYGSWKQELSRASPNETPNQGASPSNLSGPSEPFLLVVELYVRPSEEARFLAYEARVLPLLERHGIELVLRVSHGTEAQGEGAPFETHTLRVPSQEALLAFETDPTRLELETERARVLVSVKSRRGHAFA